MISVLDTRLSSLQMQTYLQLSLFFGEDKRQPEIRLCS